jgi:hypothetical protein
MNCDMDEKNLRRLDVPFCRNKSNSPDCLLYCTDMVKQYYLPGEVSNLDGIKQLAIENGSYYNDRGVIDIKKFAHLVVENCPELMENVQSGCNRDDIWNALNKREPPIALVHPGICTGIVKKRPSVLHAVVVAGIQKSPGHWNFEINDPNQKAYHFEVDDKTFDEAWNWGWRRLIIFSKKLWGQWE